MVHSGGRREKTSPSRRGRGTVRVLTLNRSAASFRRSSVTLDVKTVSTRAVSNRPKRRSSLHSIDDASRPSPRLGPSAWHRPPECHQDSPGGFTLIEILVVIVVIAILATLVAPNIFQHVGAAKDATAKSQIEMLGAALDAYRLDNGRYPTTRAGAQRAVGEADDRSAGQLARAVSAQAGAARPVGARVRVHVFPGR